jgi:cytochrome b involved in lipid metabolism
MRILALLALCALLTGCAAADSAEPLASPSQTQSVETESQTESQEESQSEPATEEAEEVKEESASPSPLETQSLEPTETQTPEESESAEPIATETPEPSSEPVEPEYSMAKIAKNNSSTSCWVAISSKAYDLTDWISRHPGGSGAIASICGTDATSTFEGKHGGQSGPASSLAAYLLGDVDS